MALRTVMILAAALAVAACGISRAHAPEVAVVVGQPFRLQPGQQARADAAALRLGFGGVAGDSRCPRGERCVWAGDATVRVWVEAGGGARSTHELHTAGGGAASVALAEYRLRLVQLDPYPLSGRPVAAADYVATLVLERAADGGGAAQK